MICLDNLNDFYDPRIKDLNRATHSNFDQYFFVKGDIRDQDQVNKIFKDNDIEMVIHLAAWLVYGLRLKIRNFIPM